MTTTMIADPQLVRETRIDTEVNNLLGRLLDKGWSEEEAATYHQLQAARNRMIHDRGYISQTQRL